MSRNIKTISVPRRKILNYILISIASYILPIKKAIASDWSYQGETGASFWGKLAPEFKTCATGQAQSPIDLDSSVEQYFGNLELDYKDTPLTIVNNNRTIRVNYAPGSSLTLDKRKYQLLQFHFHQPSEHLVSGKALAMEAHFVHRNMTTGDLLVLAVLMAQGNINRALDRVWDNIPLQVDRPKKVSDLIINAANLLPENTDNYYRYQGSLTTPPCSENVTWLVLKKTVTISRLQRDRFLKLIGNNARPVQALNNRKIY